MSTIRGRLHSLKNNPEEGFTMIELLVVLLIIGILLAIAIPTFLSTTKAANSTTAQTNLQTALTGANTYWTEEGQTYSGIDSAGNPAVSNISDIDTGVNYVSETNSSGLNVVSLWTDGSTSLVLSAYSPATHDCWTVIDLKGAQAHLSGADLAWVRTTPATPVLRPVTVWPAARPRRPAP